MTKRALLIGIDTYSQESIPDLEGCVNDVEAIGEVLRDGFGFRSDDLTVLKSADETTRERLLTELVALIERTESGDVALVYYSGHGSQVPDTTGDETDDHLDETIVPSDSGRSGDPVLDITDDELHSHIAALAQRAEQATFVFDSCHSGSVAKEVLLTTELAEGAPEFVPRAIPAADSPPSAARVIFPSGAELEGGERSAAGLMPQGEYLMIAACRDEQTAKETAMGEQRRGVLSYHLEQELRGSPQSPVREVFARVANAVESSAAEQNPVLEGPERLKEAAALGGGSGPPKPPGPPAAPPGEAKPEKARKSYEWDGWFATGGAFLVLALLALAGGAVGVLTWWVLDRGASPLEIALIVILALITTGLVLAGLGAYLGLLEARGRAHALRRVLAPGAGGGGRAVERDLLPEVAKELKGIFEQLGKMPTARALIAIGGVAFVSAAALAWHVIPEISSENAPEITTQPKALSVKPKGKALFRVSSSGSDLTYAWQRNGAAISGAESAPTYFIAKTKRSENGDKFAVVISNDFGEVVSEDVELKVLAKK